MGRARCNERRRDRERDQPGYRRLPRPGRPPGRVQSSWKDYISDFHEAPRQACSVEHGGGLCLLHVPSEVLNGSLVPFLSSPGELARLRCAGGPAFARALARAAGARVRGSSPPGAGVPDAGRKHWELWYKDRWPPFYDHEHWRCGSNQDWVRTYCETFLGQREFLLEVFERERSPGFAMSATSASVRWAPFSPVGGSPRGAFFVRYLSASVTLPEMIPAEEHHRLRFCPPTVRDRLEFNPELTVGGQGGRHYPYRILTGVDGLVPGRGVELQWKMQEGSPFGWWYGVLDSLACDPDGQTAVATITFPHFHQSSYWHQVQVTFGDGVMRSCVMGGFGGGVRPCTQDEERIWESFLPAQELSF